MNSYVIKNGHVIDPKNHISEVRDIYLKDGKITSAFEDAKVIDAKGCYVFPGLMEAHTHLFCAGTDLSVPVDVTMLPNGITSAIDCGTCGFSNFPLFESEVIHKSITNVKAFLHVSPRGLCEADFETVDPKDYLEDEILRMTERYKDEIIGLKIRMDKEHFGPYTLEPVERALQIAEKCHLPLEIHVRKSHVHYSDILKLLRRGDILTHYCQGEGYTILEDDRIIEEALQAKKRGVLFDAGTGRGSYKLDIVKKALQAGLDPDLIGTDTTLINLYERPMFNLVHVMSMYLALGMKLEDIIEKVTVNPARLMRLDHRIGSLAEGYDADVAIMKLTDDDRPFTDKFGGVIPSKGLLVPMVTVKNGTVIYQNIAF